MTTPKFFQTFYRGGAAFAVLTGVSQVWLGFTSHDNSQITLGISTLVLALVPATAGQRVKGQIADGTFEKTSPGDAVINGVDAILKAKQDASDEADRVLGAVSKVIPELAPGIDLVEAVIGLNRK